jgi:hypothetical protein
MSKLSKLIKHPLKFFKDALHQPHPKNSTSTTIAQHNFNSFESYSHLLHTGENITGLSHLDLWIPQFIKANVHFLILVRNYELFQLVKEHYPQLPLLFAKGDKEIGIFLNSLLSLKACFYPSNTGNNLHLLKFNHLKHIFIGHGDSDKTASAHKYFRVYDENWVAGDAHIDRFKNEGFNTQGLLHKKVGRPNLKTTLTIAQKPWQERFNGDIHLLYLSTWEGVYQEQNYTSIYIIQDFFQKLQVELTTLNIKLHPWIGRRDNNLKDFHLTLEKTLLQKIFPSIIHDKTIPVETLIQSNNFFICDISAVISESLAANAPIFVYIPKDKEIKLTKSKMMYEDYTYTFSTIKELEDKIEEVIINHNDYLASKREEAMEYILGKEATLNDEFIKQLQKV